MKAILSLLCSVALIASSSAQELRVGSPAPELSVEHWVQGKAAPASLSKGIFVVEFWATWCGPCRTSMPHLSELSKKYDGQIQFLGVSDEDLKTVTHFLSEGWSEKISYTLGTDPDGSMQKAWMDAAGQDGIPAAFIVSQGTIVWIGHPLAMDDILEKVASGQFDLEAEVLRAEKIAKLEAQAAPIMAQIETLWGRLGVADTEEKAMAILAEALPLFLKIVEIDPVHFGEIHMQAISIAFAIQDFDQALAQAKLFVSRQWDNAEALNGIAWTLVDPDNTPEKTDAELAIKAAKRATELTKEKDASVIDTLARAYYTSGNKESAILWGTKAIELAKEGEMKDAFQDALDEYKGTHELDF